MNTDHELRRARPSDVTHIAEIARDHIERGLAWTWREKRVKRTLAASDVLAAVAGDDVDGFCITSYASSSTHLLLLGVRPAARRGGLGSRLVQWHIDCAKVAGIGEMTLELRATNAAARRFYEQLGFETAGRRRRYYQDREDALRMVLRF